jgi:hypothetical protein
LLLLKFKGKILFMKTKEKIKNLQDIRRNLWVTSAAIIGGLAVPILNAKNIIFINEIVYCNKEINNLINKIKEE